MAKKDENSPAEGTPEAAQQAGEEALKAGEQTAKAAARNGDRARRAAESVTDNVVDAGGRLAERGMGQATDAMRRGGDQIRQLMTAGGQAYGQLGEVSHQDMDVLMQSGARLAKGVQDMGWEMMQFTQRSVRLNMKAANELMGCRTVDDMMAVSRNFMRDSLGSFLQESAKLLELSSTVASDAVTPIHQRTDARH